MPGQRPPDRILDAAAHEGMANDHARILGLLDRMTAAPDEPSAAVVAKELAQVLEVHMAEEEDVDGVFDWLCALQPSVKDVIAALIEDHVVVRTEAAKLLATPSTDPAFAGLVRAFADRIKDHERREAEVLRTATRVQ